MSVALDRIIARSGSCPQSGSLGERRRGGGVDPGFYAAEATNLPQTGVSAESPYFARPAGVDVSRSHSNRCLFELERLSELTDDWDSAGAAAPPPELITEACQWLGLMPLLDLNAALPDAIAPGVNGEIVFYWQRPGLFVEATIDRPGHVEWMVRFAPDRIRHFESGTNVAVVIDD